MMTGLFDFYGRASFTQTALENWYVTIDFFFSLRFLYSIIRSLMRLIIHSFIRLFIKWQACIINIILICFISTDKKLLSIQREASWRLRRFDPIERGEYFQTKYLSCRPKSWSIGSSYFVIRTWKWVLISISYFVWNDLLIDLRISQNVGSTKRFRWTRYSKDVSYSWKPPPLSQRRKCMELKSYLIWMAYLCSRHGNLRPDSRSVLLTGFKTLSRCG